MAEDKPRPKTPDDNVVKGLFGMATHTPEQLAKLSRREISELVDRTWSLATQIAGIFTGEPYNQAGRMLRQASSPTYDIDGKFLRGKLVSIQVLEESPFEGEHSGPTSARFYFEAHMITRREEHVSYRFVPAAIRSIYQIDEETGEQLTELTPHTKPKEFRQAQAAITALELVSS